MSRFPFPAFPTGWYAVAFSRELRPVAVTTVRFMGRDHVVFRGASGQPAMLAAHCPHMGAHLGIGGRVDGDAIRCPMHGFSFDARGTCVATGYGTKPPPTCKARSTPLVEQGGVVLAYHDDRGAPPSWLSHVDEAVLRDRARRRTHGITAIAPSGRTRRLWFTPGSAPHAS